MENSSDEEEFLVNVLNLKIKLKRKKRREICPKHFPKSRNKRALPHTNSRNVYERSRIFFHGCNVTVLKKKTFRRPIFFSLQK